MLLTFRPPRSSRNNLFEVANRSKKGPESSSLIAYKLWMVRLATCWIPSASQEPLPPVRAALIDAKLTNLERPQ